jgi:rSAM/selenodomain-associated transferase 1
VNGTLVIVFARAPIPGRVKTRLVPALGSAGAARLQVRLTRRALDTARAARPARVELHGAGRLRNLRVLQRRQRGADLGERMYRALAAGLRRYPRVLLIGSDCPALRVRDLRRAARWLAGGADAAFAPAEDGGYALIGVRRNPAGLFDGVHWSTDAAMDETRARMKRLGWSWRELPPVWDVDRPEDYRRLAASGLMMRRRG